MLLPKALEIKDGVKLVVIDEVGKRCTIFCMYTMHKS